MHQREGWPQVSFQVTQEELKRGWKGIVMMTNTYAVDIDRGFNLIGLIHENARKGNSEDGGHGGTSLRNSLSSR